MRTLTRSRPGFWRLAVLNSFVMAAVFIVLAASPAPVHFPSTHWEAIMLAGAAAVILIVNLVLLGAAVAERAERGRRAATASPQLHEFRHYEHYRVDAPDGTIGFVDEVLGCREGNVKVLIVSDGWFGARRFVVPVDEVRSVDVLNRIVTVSVPSPEATTATAPRARTG